MAEIRILTPEQVAARDAKPQGPGRAGRRRSPERQQSIAVYKEALEPIVPGYGADVELEEEEDEDKRSIRQDIQFAAQELGLALDFRPIKDKTRIHFRVITPEEKAAKPKRGGGRPRKHAA